MHKKIIKKRVKIMNYKILLIVLLTIPSNLLPITFISTIKKQATVNIYLSTQPIEIVDLICPLSFNQMGILTSYSLMANPLDQILYWKPFVFNSAFPAITPAMHVTVPTKTNNPCTISLTPDALRALAQENINQVYVLILLRTYFYNFTTKEATFFDDEILMAEFKNLNATITIEASGLIAPSQFDNVPPQLQGIYPMAIGNAT